jgi:hypothetical protein
MYWSFACKKPAYHSCGVDTPLQCKVLAMNKAFAEQQKSEADTESRHLLYQRQNVTAAPWNVAQAGHKVKDHHLLS